MNIHSITKQRLGLMLTLLAMLGLASQAPAQMGRSGAEGGSDLVRLPQEQPPIDRIGPQGWGRNIVQLAHNDLDRRGMNSAVDLTRSGCAYVGSRSGEQGALVVDITNPRKPVELGEFTFLPGSSSREVRVQEDLDLLVVMHFETMAGAGDPNVLEFFDISDCRNPVLRTTLEFGPHRLHEMHLWRDPHNPDRVLFYISRAPYLNVIDATDILDMPGTFPHTVREVATFDLNDFPGAPDARLHSASVSDDGTRVYMSDSDAGYYIVDSTPLGMGDPCNPNHLGPNPCLEKVNPDPAATLDPSPPDAGGHHSMVRVPGERAGDQVFAIVADEVGGPTACPWSWSRVLDITEEENPIQIASLLYPENLVENCPEANEKVRLGSPEQGGRFRAHNPTVLKNLMVQTNYASGVRVWDISNPYIPFETGAFFPQPVTDTTFVIESDQNQVSMWSYPVIMDGLIYAAGINDGLLVLQYKGPGHEEIDAISGPCVSNASPIESIGFLEGNCFD